MNYYQADHYDDLARFISYWHQIKTVVNSKAKKVLIVGIGNNLIGDYLKKIKDLEVSTCDIDTGLDADFLGDIRELPFKDKTFDIILACEILEHIPFQDVPKALGELYRVSKEKVVISIPYSSLNGELILRIRKITFSIGLISSFPHSLIRTKEGGEHYWEMGRLGYSKRKIKKVLTQYFIIKNEFQPILDNYHYFFELEKKP